MGDNIAVVNSEIYCVGDLVYAIHDASAANFAAIDRLVAERLPYLARPSVDVWNDSCTNVQRTSGSLLLVASTLAGETAGFLWADARGSDATPQPLPWWCINMVAVGEAFEGSKVGYHLVQAAYRKMVQADVVSVYGMCSPALADWYRSAGFSVTDPGGKLESNAKFPDGRPLSITAAPDECLFLADGDPTGTPFLYC
jgi:predicted N-acetyltransferase YhbS